MSQPRRAYTGTLTESRYTSTDDATDINIRIDDQFTPIRVGCRCLIVELPDDAPSAFADTLAKIADAMNETTKQGENQ